MLLFLIGVDVTTVVLIVILLLSIGRVVFWLIKKLLRKVSQRSSDKNIILLSTVSAFILSPIIVLGSFALSIYTSIQKAPRESDEEIERNHYEMIEDDIRKELRVGMSKADVVKLFGEADTAQAVLIYDLSLPDAKEKYVLEITFDTKGLKGFKRQP